MQIIETIPTDVDKLKIETDFDEVGDNHLYTSLETPMIDFPFKNSDEEKMAIISAHFKKIMETLGLDLRDDSLKGTPDRVGKMFVKEIFSGLNPKNLPDIKLFDNKYKYKEMLIEKEISVKSFCEHHFVPIIGKAHVAYISSGKVIGLSKINRVVEYFAKRPQVQERLTVQISNYLKQILETNDVAVVIEAKHMCVSMRGVEDNDSVTITASYSGKFETNETKNEFLNFIN